MKWVDRIKSWFRAAPKTKPGSRSWSSADTTRLNSSRWSRVDDLSINQLLVGRLKTLRMRSTYEARNNPFVAGAIRSMRVGVVGANGPRVQVMSKNSRFNEAAESVFREWFRMPDVNGELSGTDLLNQWVGYLPTAGEFFGQFVMAPEDEVGEREIRTRILTIDPRRCEHPTRGFHAVSSDDKYTILGVERTSTGKPIRYSFRDGTEDVGYTWKYRWVAAKDVIHGFLPTEAGQARGIPWVAECLDDIAELREFDEATLRAARSAAAHTALLTATGPDADFIEVDEEVEIEPGTYTTVPPGWNVSQLKPEHPTTTYREFRHERLRSVGMAFQQPLMTVLMDSSKHNYSSARFDGQTGARVEATTRRMIDQVAIERMFWRVIREAQLLRLVPATPPNVRVVTHWEPRPHVDPKKEAEASATLIAAGLSTHTRECAKYGLDYEEDVLDVLKREKEAREKRGLTDAEVGVVVTAAGQPKQDDSQSPQQQMEEAA